MLNPIPRLQFELPSETQKEMILVDGLNDCINGEDQASSLAKLGLARAGPGWPSLTSLSLGWTAAAAAAAAAVVANSCAVARASLVVVSFSSSTSFSMVLKAYSDMLSVKVA